MDEWMNVWIVTRRLALGSVRCELVGGKTLAIKSLAEQNNVVGVKVRIGTKILRVLIT